tara:strand:- start:253 stop:870 length:618 start_codon:yes stop_codon:yes gene_type:complete
MAGLFITFEGIDGCGKSTQAKMLNDRLESSGKTIFLLREPGGTPISEQIRDVLLNPENDEILSITEATLLAASRSQLTREVILPELEKGHIIICDRYFDSSIAYQGYGRGLSIQWLTDLNSEATKGANPDVTIFVDIPIEVSRERIKSKSKDRMEKEGFEFLEKVRSGYLEIAGEKQDKFITMDGTMTVEEIHSRIWDNIRKFIK